MRWFLASVAFVVSLASASASGVLLPDERGLQPLAMVAHRVQVKIQDQVAQTTVEQVFRNSTSRNLEATYIFPVPRGASVNKFSMWIDGKETSGELLEAKKANAIYTEIVRRTQDPGLLEYIGQDLLRVRVFPILPRSDQKLKISFTSVATMEQGVVEYLYPFKTDGRSTRNLEDFSVKLSLQSQHPITMIYSPTHSVDIRRKGEREAEVEFSKMQSLLDRDFQLFYGLGKQDISMTPILYRPVSSQDGYFMFLVAPSIEQAKEKRIARDLVLVLDTSGSMTEVKMNQARKALKQILADLREGDRFGIIAFASTVRHFEDKLVTFDNDTHERARKWVDDLRTSGGTAIQPALDAAIDLRPKDSKRTFTVAFFTDGLPTVDERDPNKIVQNVVKRNSENTRIFTFGVGDDVNAAMLDQLSESTKAISTYVRPSEDIEAKAAALQAKISRPAMTNVKLTTTNIKLHEIYPVKLPDLFHGGQMVVLGRYSGDGDAVVRLSGMVGSEERELVYELKFPRRTEENRDFVEQLWARRKVGFLLDQIRLNGDSKEIVEEITKLAMKYGIATPYTSFLVVPDGPMPVIGGQSPMLQGFRGTGPGGESGGIGGSAFPNGLGGFGGGFGGGGPAKRVEDYAKEQAAKSLPAAGPASGVAATRGVEQEKAIDEALKKSENKDDRDKLTKAKEENRSLETARGNFERRQVLQNQQGKTGVDLAITAGNLRNQDRLALTANQKVNGRNVIEVGGVWMDERYDPKQKAVTVKAQSEAYFRILEKQPKMKEVFRLGNYLLWITPNGTVLVIDGNSGQDKLPDADIDAMFIAPKAP
ncbi:MAG: VIT domain-containing protein [Fimbriiglobus sp.]